ncbi:MAG: hypothetical protein OEY49_00725 [Candidatus Heimdallarchaeota archaeon]|nr:hypothetical protein [Candidatus Heimdallarchaeota archaeon]
METIKSQHKRTRKIEHHIKRNNQLDIKDAKNPDDTDNLPDKKLNKCLIDIQLLNYMITLKSQNFR